MSCLVKPSVVLDVGAGIRPQQLVKPKRHICVEPHGEYCVVLRNNCEGIEVIQGTAQDVLPNIETDSVDTVTLLDVVEHLPKDQSLEVLRHAKRIARKQVVVFTPLGYMPQRCDQHEVDPWGLHGNLWQEHHSGWTVGEFPDWDVYTCEAYHRVSAYQVALENPNGAFWAIYTKWENLTWVDNLRIKHDFKVLWAWSFLTRTPWFYPFRHKVYTTTMLMKHRLVVLFRVKQLLRLMGFDIL